jgi:bifunctional DNA-binding transcriptional regulator/antitoxin component of YhaV-PrlF toxin-antitoxin module
MTLARLLQRGQLTIPQEVREKLCLEPGAVLQIEVTGPDRFEVRRVPSMTFKQMQEFARSFEDTGLDLEEARKLGEADAADAVLAKLDRLRTNSLT